MPVFGEEDFHVRIAPRAVSVLILAAVLVPGTAEAGTATTEPSCTASLSEPLPQSKTMYCTEPADGTFRATVMCLHRLFPQKSELVVSSGPFRAFTYETVQCPKEFPYAGEVTYFVN
ncbi:hypothetical protein [Amycolatopsis sp. lyj-90]|uniref:hypothetical protein n=1 Tax=Amycolatopsis sp. lyj-90 TaxID=2789285 RepID=UPI00397E11D6